MKWLQNFPSEQWDFKGGLDSSGPIRRQLSVVAFTTLGFVDITPRPGIFQMVAATEALIGAIFMAVFVFVFAGKMARWEFKKPLKGVFIPLVPSL